MDSNDGKEGKREEQHGGRMEGLARVISFIMPLVFSFPLLTLIDVWFLFTSTSFGGTGDTYSLFVLGGGGGGQIHGQPACLALWFSST